MTDVTITKQDEVWMKVTCAEKYMEMDISDRFKFRVPDAQYDPRVKYGKWDGIMKLYNRKTKRMYVGLLHKLLAFCHKQDFSVYVDPALIPTDSLEDDDLDGIIEFVKPHADGNPIELYDYQREAVKHMMTMDRSTCLAATSAGKSLILYMLVRCYQLLDEMKGKRIFICVPSTSLVEQIYSDFDDYSTFEGSEWNIKKYVQKISGDYKNKQVDMPIVVTTWQSMIKLPQFIYDDIGAIFIDECHTAKADVLKRILESCTSTPFRHGLTGTLDGTECNELVIQGLLGEEKRIVTAKQIIDQGRASDIHVNMLMFNHQPEHCKELYYMKSNVKSPAKKYNMEVEYVNHLDSRRKMILDFIESVSGNTLVLFDRVDGYGNELYEEFCKRRENTFLIVGDVEASEREDIRNSIENHGDATIFASFGTMQQGVSIKKLHNMFIVSSSKSKIRVLQSIGRMMRLHSSKEHAKIYDVVDNLAYNEKPNYMLTHSSNRVEYYSNEQFKIDFAEFDL